MATLRARQRQNDLRRDYQEDNVTEPRADRGPQAGSPLGVVDATGSRVSSRVVRSGRYRSRFCNQSKNQNPATFPLRESDRLATGSFWKKEFPLRPEHLFAGVQNCNGIRAGLLAFASP